MTLKVVGALDLMAMALPIVRDVIRHATKVSAGCIGVVPCVRRDAWRAVKSCSRGHTWRLVETACSRS